MYLVCRLVFSVCFFCISFLLVYYYICLQGLTGFNAYGMLIHLLSLHFHFCYFDIYTHPSFVIALRFVCFFVRQCLRNIDKWKFMLYKRKDPFFNWDTVAFHISITAEIRKNIRLQLKVYIMFM